jgi:hypothetical protein
VARDNFYTPGEGLGGVTVTARRASDGATFSTTTWGSGGYSLPLAAATYDVTASGAGLNGTVRFGSVAIGSQNVKRDFLPVPAATTNVTGRHVFYNNSAYDGRDVAATLADLNAIAPDKQALRPGGAASFSNITSFTGGINGVLVDFAGIPPATLTTDDFTFRSGPGINPALWPAAPAPAAVVELPNPTGSNTARYAITWPDGAIRNTWLQVTVKANANTGLGADDVFYFGNLAGETGDSPAVMRVTALDVAAVKRTLGGTATLDARTDFNRDGKVNALDVAAAKANLARTIELIAP